MAKKIRTDKWNEEQMNIHFEHIDKGKSQKTCTCEHCKAKRENGS